MSRRWLPGRTAWIGYARATLRVIGRGFMYYGWSVGSTLFLPGSATPNPWYELSRSRIPHANGITLTGHPERMVAGLRREERRLARALQSAGGE